MSKTIALKPRVTEKSYAQSGLLNVYLFDIPTGINKLQVADAVEEQFKVTVTNVRTTIRKGKQARSIRIGARTRANVSGKRPDTKLAYVTLKEGDSLPVFAAIDEQVKAEEKAAEKTAKIADKEKKSSNKNLDSGAKSGKSLLGRRKTARGGDK